MGACVCTHASNLDTIGVVLLRKATNNIDGSGIRVAQVEAETAPSPPAFEVSPNAVGHPTSLFTYASTLGSSSTFPNSVGAESFHANTVGAYFYGLAGGVATNVAHVDNYQAAFFYNSIIGPSSLDINDPVVNQSFIFGGLTIAEQEEVDSHYDDYADAYGTLFVSGPGNGGPVSAPATCYNGIAVGADVIGSSYGPTLDNGRAKPDLIAPAGYTSFSTPQAAGAAAVLMQAGLRGDGGSSTNSAADIRTVKALLLNGAVKPAGWTNGPASPLDARYGAGLLNVFNSYEQLVYGKHGYVTAASVPTGNPHPPTGATGTISTLSGWDFNTNSSTSTSDGVRHYYFNVTNGTEGAVFTATATLVWNRQQGETNINDLDLFLYDTASSNLIASSVSPVDNVEHLFVRNLGAGRYDLQVLKNGGTGGKRITTQETYALAFEFFSMSLSIAQSGSDAVVTWPIYPAGFLLESVTNLNSTLIWSTNLPMPIVTNNVNQLTLDASTGDQLFRLRRP